MDVIEGWHTMCDTMVNFNVTTPVRSSMSFTVDSLACDAPGTVGLASPQNMANAGSLPLLIAIFNLASANHKFWRLRSPVAITLMCHVY